MSQEKQEQEEEQTDPLSSREPGFESRVFGRWGSVIRYVWGTICVFTMCYIAYLDAITTRISVEKYGKWPSEYHFLIMTIGITICAMSFSNANKTIMTILSSGGLKDKAKDLVLSRLGAKSTSTQPTPTEYYWWNAESKVFVTILDSIDMTAAGFVQVPTPQPDANSVWDETAQCWMTPANQK